MQKTITECLHFLRELDAEIRRTEALIHENRQLQAYLEGEIFAREMSMLSIEKVLVEVAGVNVPSDLD